MVSGAIRSDSYGIGDRISTNYILLTPTNDVQAKPDTLDLVSRKKSHTFSTTTSNVKEGNTFHKKLSDPMIGYRVKSHGNDQDSSSESDIRSITSITPSYLCKIHAQNDGYTVHDRFTQSSVRRIEISPRVDKAHNFLVPFSYLIRINHVEHVFQCMPYEFRQLYKTLQSDFTIKNAIEKSNIHLKYLQDGFKCAVKRACMSTEKLSVEIQYVLQSLVQIPIILKHEKFQQLIRADSNPALTESLIEVINDEDTVLTDLCNSSTDSSDSEDCITNQDCLCEDYSLTVRMFGDVLYSAQFEREYNVSSEHFDMRHDIGCTYLFQPRCVLAFYTDTMYILDKEEFKPSTNLAKCVVYGFGAQKLFEITRISKSTWSISDMNNGTLMTLRLEKYGQAMNSQPMIVINRLVSRATDSLPIHDECVGFFRKSWRRGYQFLLLSELITCGRITTSIQFDVDTNNSDYLSGNSNIEEHIYSTVCLVASDDMDPIMSSTLSIPVQESYRKQRLHISEGSDVLVHLAISVAYDILATNRPFFRRDYVY